METQRTRRALISVSDKTGLVEFAKSLTQAGVEIVSSGGTHRLLTQEGISVQEVSDYTGFPEMMDGRLKTLHPKVHGGILCRRNREDDMASLAEHGILPFDLVVVNLYPFEETIAQPNVTLEEAIEQIDIGGPTLVRAAAKNHAFVAVVTSPSQYEAVAEEIEQTGHTSDALRRKLAREAFANTAYYDSVIANYFALASAKQEQTTSDTTASLFSATQTLALRCKTTLRYGENPHQAAALYALPKQDSPSLTEAEQLHGKELSYNNYLDLDAAWAIAKALPEVCAVVLKHNNPCGAASANDQATAIAKAWEGDPISAFGSVLGFNRPLEAATAEFLCEPGRFVEAIVAPSFSPEAFELLTTKPKWKANVRLIQAGPVHAGAAELVWRQIDGGMLCQQADNVTEDSATWNIVTKTKPSDGLMATLQFSWAATRFVKSNAILLAKDQAIVGVGAGQMSRVDAVEIAIKKAGEKANGSVLASDAFFPFDDSIHAAAKAGIIAIIQPGGSRRDEEVIAACNEHSIPMVFTGQRHFRH